jgi:histidinol dehydrogenase
VTPAALKALGPAVVTLAGTEGLPAHAESINRRLDALAVLDSLVDVDESI